MQETRRTENTAEAEASHRESSDEDILTSRALYTRVIHNPTTDPNLTERTRAHKSPRLILRVSAYICIYTRVPRQISNAWFIRWRAHMYMHIYTYTRGLPRRVR